MHHKGHIQGDLVLTWTIIDTYIDELFPNDSHQYKRASDATKSIYWKNNNYSPDCIWNFNFSLGCCCEFNKISILEENNENSENNNLIKFYVF